MNALAFGALLGFLFTGQFLWAFFAFIVIIMTSGDL